MAKYKLFRGAKFIVKQYFRKTQFVRELSRTTDKLSGVG